MMMLDLGPTLSYCTILSRTFSLLLKLSAVLCLFVDILDIKGDSINMKLRKRLERAVSR